MFRAIAGYLFGVSEEEPSETMVECETTELNDWLVVNMADRLGDEVVLEDQLELVSPEDDDDSVLNAVSWLMTPNDEIISFYEDDNPLAEEEVEDSSSENNESQDESEDDDSMSCTSDKADDYDDEELVPESYNKFFSTGMPGVFRKILEKHDRMSILAGEKKKKPRFQMVQNPRDETNPFRKNPLSTSVLDAIQYPLFSFDPVAFAIAYANGNKVKQSSPAKQEKPLVYKIHNGIKNQPANGKIIMDVTCHPVYSKTYINHRHPAVGHKTDVLERIKELEYEQKAKEYITQKNTTRRQLNRQNKNYIYESSCKRNRRKNFQLLNSGANNNRKGY